MSNPLFQKLVHTDDNYGSLAARLTLAIVMFPHGAQKVLGWWGGNGFSGTYEYFTATAGLPGIVALLVIFGEFLGPIGLAVGLMSRFAAFGLGLIMTGAIFMAHLQHGFFMNWYGNQAGEGFEYHLLVIGLAIVTMIQGSGALSIDRRLSQD